MHEFDAFRIDVIILDDMPLFPLLVKYIEVGNALIGYKCRNGGLELSHHRLFLQLLLLICIALVLKLLLSLLLLNNQSFFLSYPAFPSDVKQDNHEGNKAEINDRPHNCISL